VFCFTLPRGIDADPRIREDTEMRFVIPVLVVAACIASHQLGLALVSEAALGDDAALAIDIRCRGQEGRIASNCRALHAKLYRAGTLDPEVTLRDYCTRPEPIEWRTQRAPAFCIERYGGWYEG
jgi:hypothetical protein